MHIADSVIVVTGASSGLGRALALELARRGGTLVLAARRADSLADTARACRGAGARTLAVETDVTDPADVGRLADKAIQEFGRLDVWVNNAGVTLYSFLEDGPIEDHRQVIETNLFGSIHGARAVLPIFRKQHRGVLVNVGSVLSAVGQAYVPSYVISKFGVRGLSEALRVEVADEPDIHVCTVMPYAIDTPHFESAGNLVGKQPAAMPPTQSPETVARAIAGVIERPRRIRVVPRYIGLGLLMHAIMPRATERLLLDALRRWHITDRREAKTEGNLFAPPDAAGTTHGDRPPMVSMVRFTGWAIKRLAVIELDMMRRFVQRTVARLGGHRDALPAGTRTAA